MNDDPQSGPRPAPTRRPTSNQRVNRQRAVLLASLALISVAIAVTSHGKSRNRPVAAPPASLSLPAPLDSGSASTLARQPNPPPGFTGEANSTSVTTAATTVPASSLPPTTETPSTALAPQAVAPVVAPALPDEGQWRVLASTGAGPVLWATSVRPLAAQPDVIASYALFDPAQLHAALFNGTELPGGGPWNNGPRVMRAALPAMIAAFNGGFKFKHIKGGYFTESQSVKPLIDGDATLAIGMDGRIVLGVYGRDLTNDGSWASLRQNLPPVIDGGVEAVSAATEQGSSAIYWGDDFGHVTLDRRSAICRRADGLMMYVVTERVTIQGLARVLLAASCDFAMELDINGSWPQFVSFTPGQTGAPAPTPLTPEMTHLDRVLSGSTKDFIALFDPALLPPDIVR